MSEIPQFTRLVEGDELAKINQLPTKILGTATLPFDLRARSRLRAMLDTGQDIAIVLPRGVLMRDGAVIARSDLISTEYVRVKAADEELLEVITSDEFGLVRAAYHLGNRHVQLQILPTSLRLPWDYVLAEMVERMGVKAQKIFAPFDPESGAYSAGIPHAH